MDLTEKTKLAIQNARQNGHRAFLCTGRAPTSIVGDIRNIEFDGGEKAFNSFRDSVYHHYWIKEYRETEIHSSTRYVILFNSNMKIISVHILLDFYGRDDYDNGKLKFGDLLKKVMYATEGHWHKKDSSDKFEYYYKIGTFRFY